MSPILANLFLHYAFDRWMKENNPDIPFERYADDVICNCRSKAQARSLRQALEARLAMCKLELHPQKTKIVYCKDTNRLNSHPEQRFDFLGFTFRPRQSMNRTGNLFVSFSPAVSASCLYCRKTRKVRTVVPNLESLGIPRRGPEGCDAVRYRGRLATPQYM